jgi:protein-tyrosine phosphatase
MITSVTPQIFVGDSQDARDAVNQGFDATLNVAIDLDIEDKVDDNHLRRLKRHKVGLIDGRGNPPLRMVAALVLLHTIVQSGIKVLVHCHAGQSRSVMIAAMYCDIAGIAPFNEALPKIMAQRKVDICRSDLYATATFALPIAKEIVTKYGKEQ